MDRDTLRALERLMSDFTWHADRQDWAALAALFTDDGVLYLNELAMQGPAQIAAQLGGRAALSRRVTRHVWSSLRVVATQAGAAVATLCQLTFEQAAPGQAAVVRVSDVSDELRCDTQGQWRIASRRIVRVMSTA